MVTQKIDQKKSEFLGRKNLTYDTSSVRKKHIFILSIKTENMQSSKK